MQHCRPWRLNCSLLCRKAPQQIEHGRRLVETFLIFVFSYGIIDNAAARPETDGVFRMHQSSDRDIAIHIAVEADITDSPAVNAAPVGLELLDDFHGPDFRGAGNRAARKATF